MKNNYIISVFWLATLILAFLGGRKSRFDGTVVLPGEGIVPSDSSHRSESMSRSSSGSSGQVAIAMSEKNPRRALFDFSEFLSRADEVAIVKELEGLGKFPRSARRAELVALVYRRWGELAPLNAIKKISTMPRTERENHEKNILTGWTQTEPAAAWEWVGKQNPPNRITMATRRYDVLVDAMLENDNFDSTAPLIAGIADNEVFKQTAGNKLTAAWMAFDPKGASDWINGIQNGLVRASALGAAVSSIALEDPEVAAEFALGIRDEGTRSATLASAFRTWIAEGNPQEARAWILNQPKSPALDAAIDAYVRTTTTNPSGGALEIVDSMFDPARRASVVDRTIAVLKANSPAQATVWIGKFLSGSDRLSSYNEVLGRWAERSPSEAAANVAAQSWLTESERQALLVGLEGKGKVVR